MDFLFWGIETNLILLVLRIKNCYDKGNRVRECPKVRILFLEFRKTMMVRALDTRILEGLQGLENGIVIA